MSKVIYGSRAGEPKGSSYTATSREVQVSEDIIPIAELKARLSEVIRSLETRRPLIVTLNGKAAAVVMSPRAYDRMSNTARVATAIREGLEDAEAGRVISDDELGRRVRRRYRTKAK
ncbi:MAG: type II toxin-antitoxin system Phd/YefM family antitoxin [Kofleriaceae bacterium]